MENRFQQKGDQLFILQDQMSDKIRRLIAVVIASTVLCALSSMPLLAIKRDSLFFWGLAILGWGICAAAMGRMMFQLVTDRGIVFDRGRGTALVWRTRLGRRRETLHDLKSFESLHLSTWMQRVEGTRRGYMSRAYAVELRGPQESLRLEEISDPKVDAPKLAEFLKLPMVLHDENSDQKKA